MSSNWSSFHLCNKNVDVNLRLTEKNKTDQCVISEDFFDGLIHNDETQAFSKNISKSRLECQNHTLFMTKTAEKPYPLGPHIPI